MPLLKLKDLNLHYDEEGSGAPLLFIHGLGSSGLDWEYQQPVFALSYRVITVDLRGHGRSGTPKGPYSIPQMAADVLALLDHLGIAKAHVVGLSMGGAVAFQLAVDAPQRLSSMTIVNSAPYMILKTFREKSVIGLRLLILKLFGLPTMSKIISKKLFPDPAHQQLRDTFVERISRNDQAAYTASLKGLIGWSVKEQLASLNCPTLIISADQDYTPVSFKQEYIALLPNATLAVVPNSHHALPLERPEAFNQVLGEFLAAQAAR